MRTNAPIAQQCMLSIKAFAKINLYLDVISRYPDGYHQLESIMQSVSLFDLIKITPSKEISVTCTEKNLCQESNLAFKVAELLRELTGKDSLGATINIIKNIPVAAGLAGGSADAAATLIGLNILWDLGLSLAELQEIGIKIGADVPFCLAGGTMLAEGRGERLTRLTPMPQVEFVLITPPLHVSTAEVYKLLDQKALPPMNRKDQFIASLSRGVVGEIARSLGNLLEAVTIADRPIITKIKEMAIEAGGAAALMTGSGPTVFVLCQDKDLADKVANTIRSYDQSFFVEVVRPVNQGVEVIQT
ncbi:MAG: 4-(cytidine 5'-diphospho)-2-C-methyl-D-erythritol kinase [Actinomycetota bacterium]